MSTWAEFFDPEVNPADVPDYEPDFDPDEWERRHTRLVRHSCGHDHEWVYRNPEEIPAEVPEPCPNCAICPFCQKRPCACDPFGEAGW